jgi:hypothetical protein
MKIFVRYPGINVIVFFDLYIYITNEVIHTKTIEAVLHE